jgi:hypothetical protein
VKITEPGLYAITPEEYHGDLCTSEVALSNSGIRTLLDLSPAHFAARNRRLTRWPDQVNDATEAQDLGSVIHALVLDAGQQFEVIPGYDDWRKKEAQALRDDARSRGLIPLLEKKFDQARVVANELTHQIEETCGEVWSDGESELSAFWRRYVHTDSGIERDIWCRSLMDRFSRKHGFIWDLKTTERQLTDHQLASTIAGGYDIQSAFYTEGVEALCRELVGRVTFTFIFAEVEPPYSVRFVTLPESWLAQVRGRIDRAADIFAECLHRNAWPGLRSVATPDIPNWRASQFQIAALTEAL